MAKITVTQPGTTVVVGDGDTVIFDIPGGGDGNTYSGFVHAKDKDEKDFTDPVRPIIICFGRGTLIETPTGEVRVESLRPGDLVNSCSGPLPVRRVGSYTIDTLTQMREPQLRPILVRRGALGRGRPNRDLMLSPNHKLLMSDWRAQMFFGEDSVLVPVKALFNGTTIAVHPEIGQVTDCHLLLDGHGIVISNGLHSESLFLGDQSFQAMLLNTREEIRAVLRRPEMESNRHARTAVPFFFLPGCDLPRGSEFGSSH